MTVGVPLLRPPLSVSLALSGRGEASGGFGDRVAAGRMTHLSGHAVEAGASLLADDAGPGYGAEVVARIGHVGRVRDRDHRRPVDVAGSCRLLAGRRLAGGSAAHSGHKLDDPAPATAVVRAELQALKAQWRREAFRERHGVDPPPDYGLEPPAPAEASPRAGPQVAGEAPAGQESAAAGDVNRSPVIPVVDPADVTYPSDDLGAVAGPCVICQQACTSLHRVSAQVRHATCRDPVAKPAA